MKTFDVVENFESLIKEFLTTIRELRAESRAYKVTLELIAVEDGGKAGKLAREVLDKKRLSSEVKCD